MIERLVMHRFRGIRTGQLNDVRRINLFIGPNNSGKTAILELLYLAATSGRPAQFIREDLLPDETGALMATTSVRTDFLGLEPLVRLRLRHGKRGVWPENPAILSRESGMLVNLSPLANGSVPPPWTTFRLGAPLPEWGTEDIYAFTQEDIERLAMFSLPQPPVLAPGMIPPVSTAAQIQPPDASWHYLWQPDWVYRWQRQAPLDHLAVWATVGTPPAPKRVLFYDFHTANAHFTDHFARWAYHTIPDWYEKIAERMAHVFPTLAGAKIEVLDAPDAQPGRTAYIRFPQREPLAIDHFGDGTRHAFKLLATLTALAETVDDEHPGMFLWEEPELCQNPATLSRLLSEVVQIIHEKPVQLFLATHSLEVIAHITHMLQRGDLSAQDTLVFRTKLDDGALKTSWFDVDNLTAWLESGLDPRVLEDFDAPLQFELREDAV